MLILSLVAILASSTVVIQHWAWSSQAPNKASDFDKALMVINNPGEEDTARFAALAWLQDKILHAVAVMKPTQRSILMSSTKTPGARGGAEQAHRPWRRKWNGQLSLRTLPIDEALEILYDDSLQLPIKPTAAARVYRKIRDLLAEYKTIFEKSDGDLTQHQTRIQHIMTVIPAGFSALVHWGQQNKTARAMSVVWIQDLLTRLSA